MVEDNPDLTSPWGRVRLAVPAGWAMQLNNLFDVDPRTAELDDLDEDLFRARKIGKNTSFSDADVRLEIGWFPGRDRLGKYHMSMHEGGLSGHFVGRDLRILRAEVERWMHDPTESRRAIESFERTWFDGDVWVRGIALDFIQKGPLNSDPRAVTDAYRDKVNGEVRVWREERTLDALMPVLRSWLDNVISDEVGERDPWRFVRNTPWLPAERDAVAAVVTGLLATACDQGKRFGMLFLGITCHEDVQFYEIRGIRPAVLLADANRIAICFQV